MGKALKRDSLLSIIMAQKEPFLLKKFDGGWVTETISDFLDPSQSPDSENVDYSASGSIKKTYGYAELGSDSEIADIDRLIVVPDRTGIEWLMKKCGTKLKIYDKVAGNYETIKTGLTDGDYLAYEYFDNSVYFNSEVDTPFVLDLTKITRLNGALAGSEGTITVLSTAAFGATGTIYINNTAVTYTGKTATEFTGCTGTPAASDGSLAIAASVNTASIQKGVIMAQYAGRLFVANGSTVYGSKLADYDNFTVSGSGTGDGIQKTLESKINALRVFLDDNGERRLMAFTADNKIYVLDTVDDENLSLTLTTASIFKQNTAANNQSSTVVGPNDIYYVDLNNQVRSMGTKYASQGVSRVYSDSVSKDHSSLFKNKYDFSNSRAIVFEDEYWCLSKEGSGDYNNRVVIYDFEKNNWRKRTNINANDIAIYENKIIFASATSNSIMYLDPNLASDNDTEIYFRYATSDIDVNKLNFERLRRVRLAGFMSKGCVSSIKVYRDFASSKVAEFELRGDNDNISGAVIGGGSVFGSIVFGEEMFGGSGGQAIRFFIADLEMENLPDMENFRILFENRQSNVYFEITAIKPFIFPMNDTYFPDKYIIKEN